MKSTIRRAAAIAALLLALHPAQESRAQAFTASGTWETAEQSGKWQATIERQDDLISGEMTLDGGPIERTKVAGTLRGMEIEFGLLSADKELATFHGVISAGTLSGEMTMADGGTGKWSGTWQPILDRFVPIIAARSGDPDAALNASVETAKAEASSDPCAIVTSGAYRLMSSPSAMVLAGACTEDEGPQRASPADAGPQSLSCFPGPPESNPPTPGFVTGALANILSRPLQQWPRITQSEPTAIASRLQNKVAVAYNDSQFSKATTKLDRVGVAYGSTTTGVTQNPTQLVLPAQPGAGAAHAISDPVGGVDRDDAFHVATVAIVIAGFGTVFQGVGLSKSSNFGFSYDTVEWQQNIVPDQLHPADKEWLAIDTTNGASHDTRYLCWTQLFLDENNAIHSSIWFARRRPADPAFRDQLQLSSDVVFPNRVSGCQVAVGPDSSVYVAWWLEGLGGTYSVIQLRRAGNGVDFGPLREPVPVFVKPQDVDATADCSGNLPGSVPALRGHIRAFPFPSLGINQQNGSLHIAYMQAAFNAPPYFPNGEIAYVRSTDQGDTWSLPLVVSDPTPGDKFMPALAVSPNDGVIRVMWYDRRNDPNNVSIDLYLATSGNGGASFGIGSRLTSGMFGVPHLFHNFDCCTAGQDCGPPVVDCYMGDYNSTVGFSSASGFFYAWGDNSLKFDDPDTDANVPDPDVRVYAGC